MSLNLSSHAPCCLGWWVSTWHARLAWIYYILILLLEHHSIVSFQPFLQALDWVWSWWRDKVGQCNKICPCLLTTVLVSQLGLCIVYFKRYDNTTIHMKRYSLCINDTFRLVLDQKNSICQQISWEFWNFND